MRRIIIGSLLTFLPLGTFGLVANAQMAKEGEMLLQQGKRGSQYLR